MHVHALYIISFFQRLCSTILLLFSEFIRSSEILSLTRPNMQCRVMRINEQASTIAVEKLHCIALHLANHHGRSTLHDLLRGTYIYARDIAQ